MDGTGGPKETELKDISGVERSNYEKGSGDPFVSADAAKKAAKLAERVKYGDGLKPEIAVAEKEIDVGPKKFVSSYGLQTCGLKCGAHVFLHSI